MIVDERTADAELRDVIARGLPRLLPERDLPPIDSIEIRPCQYRTSFPLDEVEIIFADGRQARLLRKRLRLSALDPDIAAAKHSGMFDPQREIEIYRRVLAESGLGTAVFVGAGKDADGLGAWLLLEHVQGVEMYQVGEIRSWRIAAGWLATMHERLAWAAVDGALQQAQLIRHGPDSWQRAMHRAQQSGISTLSSRVSARLAAAEHDVIDVL